jgi:hypothetical protein
MLGSPELWSELAKLHHRRTHLLLGHFEERIRRAELEAGLLEVESDAVALANRSHRLPCLIRGTPGQEVRVYHSADAPCGHVTGAGRNISSFIRVPETKVWDSVPGFTYNYEVDRCKACFWETAAVIYGRRLLDVVLPMN